MRMMHANLLLDICMGARSGQNSMNYFYQSELIKHFVHLFLWCLINSYIYSSNYFYIFYVLFVTSMKSGINFTCFINFFRCTNFLANPIRHCRLRVIPEPLRVIPRCRPEGLLFEREMSKVFVIFCGVSAENYENLAHFFLEQRFWPPSWNYPKGFWDYPQPAMTYGICMGNQMVTSEIRK